VSLNPTHIKENPAEKQLLFEKPADILSLDGSILGVFPNRELSWLNQVVESRALYLTVA
jgi:hypothetical protein